MNENQNAEQVNLNQNENTLKSNIKNINSNDFQNIVNEINKKNKNEAVLIKVEKNILSQVKILNDLEIKTNKEKEKLHKLINQRNELKNV